MTNKPHQAATALLPWAEIYVPLEGIIDIEKEVGRLEKELHINETDIGKAEGKLSNEKFLEKAPPDVIAKEKGKLEEARMRKEGLLQRLMVLKSE